MYGPPFQTMLINRQKGGCLCDGEPSLSGIDWTIKWDIITANDSGNNFVYNPPYSGVVEFVENKPEYDFYYDYDNVTYPNLPNYLCWNCGKYMVIFNINRSWDNNLWPCNHAANSDSFLCGFLQQFYRGYIQVADRIWGTNPQKTSNIYSLCTDNPSGVIRWWEPSLGYVDYRIDELGELRQVVELPCSDTIIGDITYTKLEFMRSKIFDFALQAGQIGDQGAQDFPNMAGDIIDLPHNSFLNDSHVCTHPTKNITSPLDIKFEDDLLLEIDLYDKITEEHTECNQYDLSGSCTGVISVDKPCYLFVQDYSLQAETESRFYFKAGNIDFGIFPEYQSGLSPFYFNSKRYAYIEPSQPLKFQASYETTKNNLNAKLGIQFGLTNTCPDYVFPKSVQSGVSLSSTNINVNFWDSSGCGTSQHPACSAGQFVEISGLLTVNNKTVVNTDVFFYSEMYRPIKEFYQVFIDNQPVSHNYSIGGGSNCDMILQTDESNTVITSGQHPILIRATNEDNLYHASGYLNVDFNFSKAICCSDFGFRVFREGGQLKIEVLGTDPISSVEVACVSSTGSRLSCNDIFLRTDIYRATCADACGKIYFKYAYIDSEDDVRFSDVLTLNWTQVDLPYNLTTGIYDMPITDVDCTTFVNPYSNVDYEDLLLVKRGGFNAIINTNIDNSGGGGTAINSFTLPCKRSNSPDAVWMCVDFKGEESFDLLDDYLNIGTPLPADSWILLTDPNIDITYTYTSLAAGLREILITNVFPAILVYEPNQNTYYSDYCQDDYIQGFSYGNGTPTSKDRNKLVSIANFGPGFRLKTGTNRFKELFYNCVNLHSVSIDLFNNNTLIYNFGIKVALDLSYIFCNCNEFHLFTTPIWVHTQLRSLCGDCSTIHYLDYPMPSNTSYSFYNTKYNDGFVSTWWMGYNTDMSYMFGTDNTDGLYGKFNQPVNGWAVYNVTTMAGMFLNNKSFIQPINNWKVHSLTNAGFFMHGKSWQDFPGDNDTQKKIAATNWMDSVYRSWPTARSLHKLVPISFGDIPFSDNSAGYFSSISLGGRNILGVKNNATFSFPLNFYDCYSNSYNLFSISSNGHLRFLLTDTDCNELGFFAGEKTLLDMPPVIILHVDNGFVRLKGSYTWESEVDGTKTYIYPITAGGRILINDLGSNIPEIEVNDNFQWAISDGGLWAVSGQVVENTNNSNSWYWSTINLGGSWTGAANGRKGCKGEYYTMCPFDVTISTLPSNITKLYTINGFTPSTKSVWLSGVDPYSYQPFGITHLTTTSGSFSIESRIKTRPLHNLETCRNVGPVPF